MTEPSGLWIKLWDYSQNLKVRKLDERCFQGWVHALLAASKWKQGGLLPPIEWLVLWFGKDEGWWKVVLVVLQQCGLIDRLPGGSEEGRYAIHDWSDWQATSDTNAERQKRFRDKKREAASNVTVTTRNALETEVDREPDLEEDIDTHFVRNAGMRPREKTNSNSGPSAIAFDPLSVAAKPWEEVFDSVWRGYLNNRWGNPKSRRDQALRAWMNVPRGERLAAVTGFWVWRLSVEVEEDKLYLETFIDTKAYKGFPLVEGFRGRKLVEDRIGVIPPFVLGLDEGSALAETGQS